MQNKIYEVTRLVMTAILFCGAISFAIIYPEFEYTKIFMLFCLVVFLAEIFISYNKSSSVRALADSKSYLKNIVENVADPIFVKDREHKWIDGNNAFWDLMNRPPAEVVGKSDYDFFPKDEADVFWAKDEEVFNKGEININVESFTDSDGNKHVLSTKKAGFKLSNGEPVLVGIIRDITALRKAQDKLQESDEARLKSIMNHSGRPVYIKDLFGAYVQVNDNFIKLHKRPEEELIGKTDFELVPQQYAESWRRNDEEVVYRNKAIEFEERAPGDEGEEIFTSVKFPIYDSNGKIYATCGISTNITERKKNEETISKVMSELKKANSELERFAYVCSHDLQEPLRTIGSFAQLLEKSLEGKLDDKTEKYLRFITEGSVRARELIVDVLDYSRVDYEIEKRTSVDMKEIISAILDNLNVNLKEVGAKVTYDEMPIVVANRTLIMQLMQNLIHNAIKFSESKPKVHISAERKDDFWEFSVADNGIGIAPDYHKRIFEVFQRLNRRNEYSGNGIGLAICKKIVERHGGIIWVESGEKKGSVFFFTLPVVLSGINP